MEGFNDGNNLVILSVLVDSGSCNTDKKVSCQEEYKANIVGRIGSLHRYEPHITSTGPVLDVYLHKTARRPKQRSIAALRSSPTGAGAALTHRHWI